MAFEKFLSFAFLLFILCLFIISLTEAQNSTKPLFYNPKETPKSLKSSSTTPQAEIIPYYENFLMRLSIGTPPVKILAYADTGSDLIWLQCEPCPQSQCFKEEAPLFYPKKSSTYNSISCSSCQCDTKLCSEGNCMYSNSYGSGSHASFSSGNLATETLTFSPTFGQPVKLPKIIIGCGHNNSGSKSIASKKTGIIGLGPGKFSLISQMGASIAGKFSYCLADQGSGRIKFGKNAVVSGAGVVFTPLILLEDHYFLTLEAISVGKQRLELVSRSTVGGNIFIDSGVLRTLLPLGYYSKLKSVMRSMIEAQPVEAVPAEGGLSEVLCYNISSRPQFPEVIVHFKGADVKLSPSNLFRNVSDAITCSAFRGGISNTVYGNMMQTNFLIGYDIEQRTVSFKPADCTKK